MNCTESRPHKMIDFFLESVSSYFHVSKNNDHYHIIGYQTIKLNDNYLRQLNFICQMQHLCHRKNVFELKLTASSTYCHDMPAKAILYALLARNITKSTKYYDTGCPRGVSSVAREGFLRVMFVQPRPHNNF